MREFWQISIGNILTILGGIFTVVVMWQKIRDKVDELLTRQAKTESEVAELTRMGIMTTLNQHERRLTMIETLSVDVSGMKSDIAWIKDRLRERKGIES